MIVTVKMMETNLVEEEEKDWALSWFYTLAFRQRSFEWGIMHGVNSNHESHTV